jgi:hypothetical protein
LDRFGVCRPMTAPPPPNYGQTPWASQLAVGQEALAAMRTAK